MIYSTDELSEQELALLEAIKELSVENIAPTFTEHYISKVGVKRTSISKLIKELIKKGFIMKHTHGKCRIVIEKNKGDVVDLVSTVIADIVNNAREAEIKGNDIKVLDEINREAIKDVAVVQENVSNPDIEIKQIINLYRNRINRFIARDEEEGIRELYFWLKDSRKVDALDYMNDAIPVFAKKHESKRQFPYYVRMLRNWGLYGKWHMPTQEDALINEIFVKLTGIEPSEETRNIMLNLTGKYGAIKLTYVMTDTLKEELSKIDFSKIYIDRVKQKLETT